MIIHTCKVRNLCREQISVSIIKLCSVYFYSICVNFLFKISVYEMNLHIGLNKPPQRQIVYKRHLSYIFIIQLRCV